MRKYPSYVNWICSKHKISNSSPRFQIPLKIPSDLCWNPCSSCRAPHICMHAYCTHAYVCKHLCTCTQLYIYVDAKLSWNFTCKHHIQFKSANFICKAIFACMLSPTRLKPSDMHMHIRMYIYVHTYAHMPIHVHIAIHVIWLVKFT